MNRSYSLWVVIESNGPLQLLGSLIGNIYWSHTSITRCTINHPIFPTPHAATNLSEEEGRSEISPGFLLIVNHLQSPSLGMYLSSKRDLRDIDQKRVLLQFFFSFVLSFIFILILFPSDHFPFSFVLPIALFFTPSFLTYYTNKIRDRETYI